MGHSIGAGMVLLLVFSPAINKAGGELAIVLENH